MFKIEIPLCFKFMIRSTMLLKKVYTNKGSMEGGINCQIESNDKASLLISLGFLWSLSAVAWTWKRVRFYDKMIKLSGNIFWGKCISYLVDNQNFICEMLTGICTPKTSQEFCKSFGKISHTLCTKLQWNCPFHKGSTWIFGLCQIAYEMKYWVCV